MSQKHFRTFCRVILSNSYKQSQPICKDTFLSNITCINPKNLYYTDGNTKVMWPTLQCCDNTWTLGWQYISDIHNLHSYWSENFFCIENSIHRTIWLEKMKVNLDIFSVRSPSILLIKFKEIQYWARNYNMLWQTVPMLWFTLHSDSVTKSQPIIIYIA